MKYKLVIMAAVIAIAGCSKKDTATPAASPSVDDQIEKVRSARDFQSGVQMYNLLSKDARFKMWNDHLVKARQQFLSAGQKSKVVLVDDALANLASNVFAEQSRDAEIFSNYFIPTWSAKAKKVFTDKEIYDLVFDPAADPIGTLVAPPDIGGGDQTPPSCFCHAGESGFSCRKITVNFPTGVTIVNGICENSSVVCNPSSTGCGWFWIYSCNGNHCNF